jgi:hypothetical protein
VSDAELLDAAGWGLVLLALLMVAACIMVMWKKDD